MISSRSKSEFQVMVDLSDHPDWMACLDLTERRVTWVSLASLVLRVTLVMFPRKDKREKSAHLV